MIAAMVRIYLMTDRILSLAGVLSLASSVIAVSSFSPVQLANWARSG
jgi:hypothetical protein